MSNYVVLVHCSSNRRMPAKHGKLATKLRTMSWLMLSIVDVSGASWVSHGVITLQMTKWWHNLDKWHYTTQVHDTVATRRRRFVGHILRLPATRSVSLALEWTSEDGRRRLGRPKRTWQDILKEIWKRWVWTGVLRDEKTGLHMSQLCAVPSEPFLWHHNNDEMNLGLSNLLNRVG